jgi:flagellar hook-basal body complex protein FliE
VVNAKALLTTTFVASTVFAQGPAPTPIAPPSAGGAGGAVDISVKQRPTLTPEEMVNQAKDYGRNMNEALKRVQTLQEQAKREKDIIRLNCVTDKVVQVRVNISIAEQSMAALQEAVTRADEGERTHEFTRLTIVNQKVQVLGAEAENCIGEDLSFVGATRIDVEVDPNIPQYDPTLPPAPGIDIERPGEASPLTG